MSVRKCSLPRSVTDCMLRKDALLLKDEPEVQLMARWTKDLHEQLHALRPKTTGALTFKQCKH